MNTIHGRNGSWVPIGVATLLTVLIAATVQAATNSWIDGSGKWEATSNWSLGAAPSTSDTVDLITNAGNTTVTIDAATAGSFPATMMISNLMLSAPGLSTNTLFLNSAGTGTPLRVFDTLIITNGGFLTITNSALRVDGVGGNPFLVEGEMRMTTGASVLVSNASVLAGMRVGSNPGGRGTLTVAGGTLSVSAVLRAGGYAGSTGTIWVTGGSVAVADKLGVATYGTGQMTVSNGTVSPLDLIVGEMGGSCGTLTLAGGATTVSNDVMVIGAQAAATGAVWVTGGQLTVTNNTGQIAIEVGGGGVGQMTVSNGTVRALQVEAGSRDGGVGTFTMAGGTVTAGRGLFAAGTNTSRGAIWITGGQLQVSNEFVDIGFKGLGQLTISNGSVSATNMIIADFAGSQGTFTMADGTLTLSGFMTIGNGGTGTAFIAGGNLIVNNSLGNFFTASNGVTIGLGNVGQVAITNGTAFLNPLIVGGGANGTLTLSGGNLFVAASNALVTSGVAIGNLQGVTGTVWISGGQLTVTNNLPINQLQIGSFGMGRMIVSGGVVRANSIFVGTFPGSEGTLTVAGGTVIVNLMRLGTNNNARGTLRVTGGTFTVLSGPTSALLVGDARGATGAVTITGGNIVATNVPTRVGSRGVGQMMVFNGTVMTRETTVGAGTNTFGTLTVSGGNMLISSNLTAAPAPASTGTVMVTGGQLSVTNGIIGIGNDGTPTNGVGVGQMTVSNGTVLADTILLGSTAGGQGSLTVQSGGVVSFPRSNSLLSVNSLTVLGGALPVGVLDMVNGTLKVGVVSNGTMTVDGGIASCADVIIGEDALGTCRMKAGTLTMASALTVGNNPASTGIIWMDGGNWLSSSRTTIGNNGTGQMTISNGTITLPRVVVSGIGTSQNPGTFTMAGGAAYSTNLVVGFDVNSTGTVWVTGGELDVTNTAANAPLVTGRSGRGLLTLSNGTVVVDQLLVTNGTKSTFSFVGGTIRTRNTLVANAAQFVAGDGTSQAMLNLLGGSHTFANGLEIRNNTVLKGCGTINGTVVVDPGCTVIADCGGILTFTGSITNNGIMHAVNGSVLEFYGPVVNNGIIDIMDGTTNFHSNFVNNGTVVDPSYFRVVSLTKQTNDITITWATVGGRSYVVQTNAPPPGGSYTNNFSDFSFTIDVPGTTLGTTNFLDSGGATNRPSRYYRILLVP